jgi:hypothetical protein
MLIRLAGFVFGMGFLAVGLLGIRHGLRTLSWASTSGTVLVSERVGMGDHQAGKIEVEYRVGEYRYHCGVVTSGRDNTWNDTERYPVGSRVFYDVTAPAKCVLVPGVSVASVVFTLCGLGFLLGWGIVVSGKLGASAQRPASA